MWWWRHKPTAAACADVAVVQAVETRLQQGVAAVFFGGDAVVLVVSPREGMLWVDWVYAFVPGAQVVAWVEALRVIARAGGFERVGCRALSVARARLFRRVGFVGSADNMVLEV